MSNPWLLRSGFPLASKIGRDCVTPEEFFEHLEEYACPIDFNFETKYSRMCNESWGDTGCQGDCKQCWDSEVIDNEHAED